MLILRDGDDTPESARGGAVAIGNFDGVHRGHKALIAKALEEARSRNAPAGVIIFEPHPSAFFHPDEPHFRLTPLPEKLRLLAGLGLDFVVVLDFNATLAGMSAQQFVENILVERLGVAHVVIGYDFFFGRKRSGTAETMLEAGKAAGFTTCIVEQQAEDGEVFSSTAIRLHLAQGDVAGAARLLGHWWRVGGRVAEGNKLGRDLGFPTANVNLPPGTSLKHGIYAVRVMLGDGSRHGLAGAAYYGLRPSVDNGSARLEVFILDFEGDLYGQEIAVEFVGYVRGDRRFEDLAAMTAQITKDCDKAREILKSASPCPLADAQPDC
ncbi:MAG: bifunctional riboflavin kinase/FMN adenylyltransferase [Alphaproteobacteria bacterium BRH_c36]|nr:MAG: bifunctional riboflavin kinase/FMN adenylyltransferase [Alphaproteobacteria bacterium BRH_c36]